MVMIMDKPIWCREREESLFDRLSDLPKYLLQVVVDNETICETKMVFQDCVRAKAAIVETLRALGFTCKDNDDGNRTYCSKKKNKRITKYVGIFIWSPKELKES